MKYTIYIAQYIGGKTRFSRYIGMQQRFQGIPEPFCSETHSELVWGYHEDLEVIRKIRKIKSVYGDDNINLNAIERENYFQARGLWFSSSEVDGGARFKCIRDNGNWEFFEMEVTRDQYLHSLDFCMEREKNTYAWMKIIFTQVFKTLWFTSNRSNFCSEVVAIVLLVCFGIYLEEDNISRINPGKLGWFLDQFHKNKGDWVKSFQKNIS